MQRLSFLKTGALLLGVGLVLTLLLGGCRESGSYTPEERAAVVAYLRELNQAANDFNAASPDLNEVIKMTDVPAMLAVLDKQIGATIAYRQRVESIPLPLDIPDLADLRRASLRAIDLYANVEGTIRAAAVDGSLFTRGDYVADQIGHIMANPEYDWARRLEQKLIARYSITGEEILATGTAVPTTT